MVQKYVRPLLRRIDTLILGCTHYGHLETMIKRAVGKNVHVISEGKVVARKLKDYLARHPEIESRLSRQRRSVFYSTDLTERFKKLGGMFYGKSIKTLYANLS
jgi:glutamate racemase